jgi:methyl-accepting chemotaxis protein
VTNNISEFTKSDIGAQSAWKGFSSQTLYIAFRIATDTDEHEYFPENVEDLVVKKDGVVIEAVQVKNISADLTLSSLASTRLSRNEEGFFKRVCNLHTLYPSLSIVRIIYFNLLGEELTEFINGDIAARNSILKKLTDNHEVPMDCAEWLLSTLVFEKVDVDQLQAAIAKQLINTVPVMAAPDLAQSLLIQHVSDLSKTKGSINFKLWQELIYQIGTDIAAIDGYYKEYQKSLLRLCDLTLDKSIEQLKAEFEQGISAHPAHIRNDLDFQRTIWLERLAEKIENDKVIIVKGVSGQGKSALCYRFLINNYPENFIFCVRGVDSSKQAENLAIALKGIAKHTNNIVVYIDVNPGEQHWILLIKELQARGVSIPIIVSIREEDYKRTAIDGSSVSFEVVELSLSRHEAEKIYEAYTNSSPHPQFRSFEEAWAQFGGDGPFLEFTYLLTNNQTLKQRLIAQIDNLLREGNSDSWVLLLQLVCFAGKTGCPIIFDNLNQEVPCNNLFAAIQRLSNEYLIRKSEDGVYIEALHPLRAKIICEVLSKEIGENSTALMLSVLKCIDSTYIQLFLMDYFSVHASSPEIIEKIAIINQQNWIACAGLIKTMLWLDVKQYVLNNREVIDDLVKKHGSGWLPFLPIDISGLIEPNEMIIEKFPSMLPNHSKEAMVAEFDNIKKSFKSFHVDYKTTDLLIKNCSLPLRTPKNDEEWSDFGYSLFWCAKRGRSVSLPFTIKEFITKLSRCDIKSSTDAILGIYEQRYLDHYTAAIKVISERMVEEYCILHFSVTDTEVQCHFVPPIIDNQMNENWPKNFNHYWKMKVVNILDHMYPDKEFIEVTLIGVDLLKDLGIEAHDYKANIPKRYRHNAWITEINGWVKTRIDYSYRPDSWEKYLSRVYEIRGAANKLITDTILCIDYLYKKQHINSELIKKLSGELNTLNELLHFELLLPKSVVDSYCLFREDMNINETDPMPDTRLGISYDLYSNFRKSFNDTYRYLLSFFDQFVDVLSARKNRQNVDDIIKNSFLSQSNLFDSAKALNKMQKEFSRLFFNYRIIDSNFEDRETKDSLTLLNIWEHVTKNPVRGISIAYEAKQLFIKSEAIVDRAFKDALSLLRGETHVIDSKTYILINFNPYSGSTLKDEYERVVLILRNVFTKANSLNSVRWYLETQSLEIIYVPVIENVPLSVGFQVPVYRILDTNISQLSSALFPAELPASLSSILDLSYEELLQWKFAIGYFGTVNMLIAQYNDAIDAISSSTAVSNVGVTKYINTISGQLLEMLKKLTESMELPIKILDSVADENIRGAVEIIKSVFEEVQAVHQQISRLHKLSELDQKINNAVGLMLLLQPYILAYVRTENIPRTGS